MRLFVALAATVLLMGCASSTARYSGGGADTLRTCERIVYGAREASDATTLRCATVVGAWE